MKKQYLTDTCYKQFNKQERYKKRLLSEAFQIAKDESLKIQIGEGHLIDCDTDIYLFANENGVRVEKLLALASKKFPSLYRKYQESDRKFDYSFSEFEKMLNL